MPPCLLRGHGAGRDVMVCMVMVSGDIIIMVTLPILGSMVDPDSHAWLHVLCVTNSDMGHVMLICILCGTFLTCFKRLGKHLGKSRGVPSLPDNSGPAVPTHNYTTALPVTLFPTIASCRKGNFNL